MDNGFEVNLFCIPYAGGLSSVYYRWKKYLDPCINLIPLELGGRGKRSGQQLYNHVQHAVIDLFEQVRPQMDGKPFSIFGHSFGALMAYELARFIKIQLDLEPLHVFFSGKLPLHIQNEEKLHLLPMTEFEKYIIGLGGIPQELQNCREMLDMCLPIIRSDIRLSESYQLSENNIRPLQNDISVLFGFEDSLTNPTSLSGWELYTTSNYQIYGYSGGHFFINEQPSVVVGMINRTLNEYKPLTNW
jgi:surfactin synthase thioesterase subunit